MIIDELTGHVRWGPVECIKDIRYDWVKLRGGLLLKSSFTFVCLDLSVGCRWGLGIRQSMSVSSALLERLIVSAKRGEF